jgi:uncharacterized membrane protein YkoI
VAFAVFAAGTGSSASPANAPGCTIPLGPSFDPQKYTTKVRRTMPQAITVALTKIDGRVAWAGLEEMDGCLFYGVEVIDVKRDMFIVTIDAGDGTVRSVERKEPAVDVGDAPVEAESDKGGVPKEAPELSMVKGNIRIPEHTRESEYPWMAKITMQQAMQVAFRKHHGKFQQVSIYDEKDTLMYGIEIVQAGSATRFGGRYGVLDLPQAVRQQPEDMVAVSGVRPDHRDFPVERGQASQRDPGGKIAWTEFCPPHERLDNAHAGQRDEVVDRVLGEPVERILEPGEFKIEKA